MSRGDSLTRQWKLIQLLEDRRSVAVPEVARELGYTVRTVYRDLGVLERFGIPIYQERVGSRSRWRVVDGARRKLSLTLSWSEMLALTAARQLLAGLSGTLFHEAAVSGMEKIRRALPPELVRRADAVAIGVSAGVGVSHDYSNAKLRVEELLLAIEKRETVELDYRKPGAIRRQRRLVDPLHLSAQSGALYLIGFAHDRDAQRIFLLDRISGLKRTGRSFGGHSLAVDVSSLMGAFGPWSGRALDVRLRVSARAAPFLAERKMHPSQKSQWRSDRSLDVSLRIPASPMLLQWLTGLADDLLAVNPESLRVQVLERHRAAAAQFAAIGRGNRKGRGSAVT